MERESEDYAIAKDLHIRVCLEHDVESARAAGFERVKLKGGLPSFDVHDIDTTVRFLNKRLSIPLLIAPITGGGSQSRHINGNLAGAAERCGIALTLGSSRPLLQKKVKPDSYMVRDRAPTIPLLANLGLMHVKEGREYCLEAVESMHADALMLYVNPLHEILQARGEKDFSGILDGLGDLLRDFPYPVFLKEVGFGLQDEVLMWAGKRDIAGIDVAGSGGTNWARIEGFVQGKDYSMYEGLGRSTKDALIAARKLVRNEQCLIASGGIRSGIDIAKCLTLGASMTAMALPFLRWAAKSEDDVVQGIEKLKEELIVAMWYCGCRVVPDLAGKVEEMRDP